MAIKDTFFALTCGTKTIQFPCISPQGFLREILMSCFKRKGLNYLKERKKKKKIIFLFSIRTFFTVGLSYVCACCFLYEKNSYTCKITKAEERRNARKVREKRKGRKLQGRNVHTYSMQLFFLLHGKYTFWQSDLAPSPYGKHKKRKKKKNETTYL